MPDICPHITFFDADFPAPGYATEAHRCHRPGHPTRISLGHQEQYCLTEDHIECPVYQGYDIRETLPFKRTDGEHEMRWLRENEHTLKGDRLSDLENRVAIIEEQLASMRGE